MRTLISLRFRYFILYRLMWKVLVIQVVDSMVVEKARGESQGAAGSLQSLCWGSSATGGIVSAYFSGYLVETYGTRYSVHSKIANPGALLILLRRAL